LSDATDSVKEWTSSNPKVATVDNKGKVTAVTPGTVAIVATTQKGLKATCTVTVPQHTTVIAGEELVQVNREITLTSGSNDKAVTGIWKITGGTGEAYISPTTTTSSITVRGKTAGTVRIQFTPDDKITYTTPAEKVITVTKGETVALDYTVKGIKAGESYTFTAKLSDATDSVKEWTSSNTKIATVDSKGKVTAVAPGIVAIVATTQKGLKATCTVTVPQYTTVIAGEESVYINREITLTSGANGTAVKGIWKITGGTGEAYISPTTSTAVLTVRGKTVGTVRIQFTPDDKNTYTTPAEKVITVVNGATLTLDYTAKGIRVDEDYTFTAKCSDATDSVVEWTSSNEKIATVDSKGKVTAHYPGTVAIVAISKKGLKATCTVTVPKQTTVISAPVKIVKVGETIELKTVTAVGSKPISGAWKVLGGKGEAYISPTNSTTTLKVRGKTVGNVRIQFTPDDVNRYTTEDVNTLIEITVE